MKKIILSLGAVTAVVAPVTTIVACGGDNGTTEDINTGHIIIHKSNGKIVSVDVKDFNVSTLDIYRECKDPNQLFGGVEGLPDFMFDKANTGKINLHIKEASKEALNVTKDVVTLSELNAAGHVWDQTIKISSINRMLTSTFTTAELAKYKWGIHEVNVDDSRERNIAQLEQAMGIMLSKEIIAELLDHHVGFFASYRPITNELTISVSDSNGVAVDYVFTILPAKASTKTN